MASCFLSSDINVLAKLHSKFNQLTFSYLLNLWNFWVILRFYGQWFEQGFYKLIQTPNFIMNSSFLFSYFFVEFDWYYFYFSSKIKCQFSFQIIQQAQLNYPAAPITSYSVQSVPHHHFNTPAPKSIMRDFSCTKTHLKSLSLFLWSHWNCIQRQTID